MTATLALRALLTSFTLASLAWLASPACAQEEANVPPGWGAVAGVPPDVALRQSLEQVAAAWSSGDPVLARRLAVDARRAAPEDPMTRLVLSAVRTELHPHVVLQLDAEARQRATDELDAIDAQRLHGHIVGIVSGVVGLAGIAIAVYVPELMATSMSCGLTCPSFDTLHFVGGSIGLLALVGAGVALGLQVDAGARLGRWADGLRVDLGPGSLALRF